MTISRKFKTACITSSRQSYLTMHAVKNNTHVYYCQVFKFYFRLRFPMVYPFYKLKCKIFHLEKCHSLMGLFMKYQKIQKQNYHKINSRQIVKQKFRAKSVKILTWVCFSFPQASDCTWKLKVPSGQRIEIRFTGKSKHFLS